MGTDHFIAGFLFGGSIVFLVARNILALTRADIADDKRAFRDGETAFDEHACFGSAPADWPPGLALQWNRGWAWAAFQPMLDEAAALKAELAGLRGRLNRYELVIGGFTEEEDV